MPQRIFALALSGLLTFADMPDARPSASVANHRRESAARALQQQAYFARRLTEVLAKINRRQRAGLLRQGPASFMRQDLTRISVGVDRFVQQGEALSAQEEASYVAMLRRVEQRLAPGRVRASRRPVVSPRTGVPAFPAAS